MTRRINAYEQHYRDLMELLGYDAYRRIEVAGHKPLTVERREGQPIVSLCRYGEQNGDLLRDPELCFRLRGKEAVPIYYRNDYLGLVRASEGRHIRDASEKAHLQSDLDSFASAWLDNLRKQGFFQKAQEPCEAVAKQDKQVQHTGHNPSQERGSKAGSPHAEHAYSYHRGKDGCDETWDIWGPDGKHLVSIPFWEAVEETEQKAQMIVHRLNMHEELLETLQSIRATLRGCLHHEVTEVEIAKAHATADAAIARAQDPRTTTTSCMRTPLLCSIESGNYRASLHGQYNSHADTWTYQASISCGEELRPFLRPMLKHELAGVIRQAESHGVDWLSGKQAELGLPQPTATTEQFQDFVSLLQLSNTLIDRFVERGHEAVLQDQGLAQTLKPKQPPLQESHGIARGR
jgi:hypothetical protein